MKVSLPGVPVAVKSAFSTERLPTTWGTPIHRDQVLRQDADLVAALASAGAVIIGKTTLTEYCSAAAPATLNPHDPTRTPGGSSSGSAAAVAAGMVPAALGSQTMGSIIRPASYCGVYGFKPSFGIVSRGGLQRVSDELDTVGWFTNTPQDAWLLLSAVLSHQTCQIKAAGTPRGDGEDGTSTVLDTLSQQQHPCTFTRLGASGGTINTSEHPQTKHSNPNWPFIDSQAADAHLISNLPDTHAPGSSDIKQPLLGARIARISCTICEAEASQAALTALESAEQELLRLGAEVTRVPLPPDIQGYFEATQVRHHSMSPCHIMSPCQSTC